MAGLSLGLLLVTSVGILSMVAVASSDPNCDGQKAFSPRRNSNDQCSYYYDLLEDALINDSDVLYRLKNKFFPFSSYELEFNVTIIVDEITLGRNCNSGYPTFHNSSGKWTAQFLRVWRQFDHEPVSSKDMLDYITSVCLYEAYSFEGAVGLFRYNYDDYRDVVNLCYIAEIEGGTVSIPLYLNKLPCNPDPDVTENALTSLLSWVSYYHGHTWY